MQLGQAVIEIAVDCVRNDYERDRNPQFNLFPSTVATGIYRGIHVAVMPYLKEQNEKVQLVASHMISFAASLVLSAAVIRSLGHRSFSWVSDLTHATLFSLITQVACGYQSRTGLALAEFVSSLSRNLIEKSRNPEVDLVALTIPNVIGLGVACALSEKVAKLTGLQKISVKVALPIFAAWALTTPACSLLGRKVIPYPTLYLALALMIVALSEVVRPLLPKASGEESAVTLPFVA